MNHFGTFSARMQQAEWTEEENSRHWKPTLVDSIVQTNIGAGYIVILECRLGLMFLLKGEVFHFTDSEKNQLIIGTDSVRLDGEVFISTHENTLERYRLSCVSCKSIERILKFHDDE